MTKIPEISVSSDWNIRYHLAGGGPLILVGIFRPKFAVPFLTNQFFPLIRGFGRGYKVARSIPIGWSALIGFPRLRHGKLSFAVPPSREIAVG